MGSCTGKEDTHSIDVMAGGSEIKKFEKKRNKLMKGIKHWEGQGKTRPIHEFIGDEVKKVIGELGEIPERLEDGPEWTDMQFDGPGNRYEG